MDTKRIGLKSSYSVSHRNYYMKNREVINEKRREYNRLRQREYNAKLREEKKKEGTYVRPGRPLKENTKRPRSAHSRGSVSLKTDEVVNNYVV